MSVIPVNESVIPISVLKKALKNKSMEIKVEPMKELSEERMALIARLIREHTMCILKKEAQKIDKQFMDMK